MMNRYRLFWILTSFALPAFGQSTADYYQLPDRGRQYERLLNRYGGAYTRDRWYVGLDGFVRTDRAQLNNDFGGLLASGPVAKVGGSVVIGWAYRERWAVEAGYAYMPLHTQLTVGRQLSFQYANEKQGIVLRAKRLILSTSGPWHRSGFWLSAGVWAIPNAGITRDPFSLRGYGYRGRNEAPDSLRITATTQTSTHPTGLAEVGMEYNIRLGSRFDLGFAVRKFWGLGNSLTTDVTYRVNSQAPQYAQLTANGAGMSYGLTLRYNYAIRRNLPSVLNVRGRSRLSK